MANANDKTFPAGRAISTYLGEVNFGDTTAKDLFQLPAGCVIIDANLIGYYSAASNATAGSISVGISPSSGGAGNEFLNKYSVTQAQGSNYAATVPWTRFGAQNSNTWTAGSANTWTPGSNSFWVSGQVTGTLGAGSGPWMIVFQVITI